MYDSTPFVGAAILIGLLIIFGIIAIFVLRRQGRSGRGDHGRPGEVPPPVDPGASDPGQARDLNAEK